MIGPAVFRRQLRAADRVYYLCAAYALGGGAARKALPPRRSDVCSTRCATTPSAAAFVGYDPHAVRFLAFCSPVSLAGIAWAAWPRCISRSRAPRRWARTARRPGCCSPSWAARPISSGRCSAPVLLVFTTVQLSEWTPAWQLYLGLLFLFMVMRAPQGGGLLVGLGRLRPAGRLAGLAADAALTRAGGWRRSLLGAGALVELIYRLRLGCLGRVPLSRLALDSGSRSELARCRRLSCCWAGPAARLLSVRNRPGPSRSVRSRSAGQSSWPVPTAHAASWRLR